MNALLSVRGLSVHFRTRQGIVRAVEDVSFDIVQGETLALVGESGSGKSTVAAALMRIVASPPGSIAAGEILFEGRDLVKLPDEEMREIRGSRIAMIFQDPMMALNPVHTIGAQIAESLVVHTKIDRRKALERAVALLELVRVPAPGTRVRQYPHNLSGGMRQRVMIAMALACDPKLLVADEPTTALDVTIQAQVLELIGELKSKLGMAVLLITHDLGVVGENADRVVVMYAGRKVEEGRVEDVFRAPAHPYTRGLMRVSDWEGASGEVMPEIRGTVPSPFEMPPGCSFAPRCELAVDACRARQPALVALGEARSAACILVGERAP
ncbi:MAG: ABC transporter ATP-binding protein [Pseudomonadota bacterium]|nr:ABC transporter ATP-binding protein [Pseudomonadota bacterium]